MSLHMLLSSPSQAQGFCSCDGVFFLSHTVAVLKEGSYLSLCGAALPETELLRGASPGPRGEVHVHVEQWFHMCMMIPIFFVIM